MSILSSNHSYSSVILRHKYLPIYKTKEFDFFRCVNFDNWVYGKTVSKLQAGNLRSNDNKGRYSRLFPDEKISYWADSKETALAEIRKHGGNKNYITFWSYDDASSTFPTLNSDESLVIVDGLELNFYSILTKIEENEPLSSEETEIIELIRQEKPDCLVYKSVAKESGKNFLFFEKGFNKLSLREIRLHIGEGGKSRTEKIVCALGCDYSPIIDSYGMYFEPILKTKMDNKYLESDEYRLRRSNYEEALKKMRNAWEE